MVSDRLRRGRDVDIFCGDGSRAIRRGRSVETGARPRYRLFCDVAENGVPNAKRYLQGLHEGISSMRVGETAHFILVPEKAYGRKGRYPAVPGYSKESPRGTWIHVEVELLRVEPPEASATGTELVDANTFSLLQRPDGYDWQGMDHDTTNAFRNEKVCAWCRKPERMMHGKKRFKRCGRCKTTIYCSTQCGTEAWPHHKLVCAKPEDHVVLEAEAHYQKLLDDGAKQGLLTDGTPETAADAEEPKAETTLATRRVETISAFVREKLGDAPARVCLIVAYSLGRAGFFARSLEEDPPSEYPRVAPRRRRDFAPNDATTAAKNHRRRSLRQVPEPAPAPGPPAAAL